MRNKAQILSRLEQLQTRFKMLESKHREQAVLPNSQQDKQLMQFLLEEQATYQLAISQLTWVLDENSS